MRKSQLTTAQIRQIIVEELVDHYVTQRELWGEEVPADRRQKQSRPNKGDRTA